jgi:hypothetical protein
MSAHAQELKPLATDFLADDKVIELDVPLPADGMRFLIVWLTPEGEYKRTSRVARAGTHAYEMRHLPEWEGQLRAVAISLQEIPGRLKTPGFFDEIDMFLEPERITPSAVNLALGHSLFGYRWNTVLLLILALSAAGAAVLGKTPFTVSLVMGFVLAWGVMDLRSIYDHAVVVYKMEKHQQGMIPLKEVGVFADQASAVIGRGSWGHAPLDPVIASFLIYRLAEQEYVGGGSQRVPDYWITPDPTEGQVLLEHANYYLVKRRIR